MFPRCAIEGFGESFLIECMTDESDGSRKDEKGIKKSGFDIRCNLSFVHTDRLEDV